MLAYINNRLHHVEPEINPAIIIYGSCPKRMNEICIGLKKLRYRVIPVYNGDEVVPLIKTIQPALVIIGGKCSPEMRMMVRHVARGTNPNVLFSEPGIGYVNTTEAIINDVLKIELNKNLPNRLFTQAV